jgi:hypothetical protein
MVAGEGGLGSRAGTAACVTVSMLPSVTRGLLADASEESSLLLWQVSLWLHVTLRNFSSHHITHDLPIRLFETQMGWDRIQAT